MKTDSKLAIEATIKQTYPGMVTEMDVDWEMIEIAFQAGVKEVVDWIDKNPVFLQSNTLGIKMPIAIDQGWQAQLKDWGIE